ncbi:ATPase with bromodomain protein [Dirofilaria immitis]
MFEEKEPGKPKNWGYTVAIITLMMILNITVIVICRILLDSHDENNNPWLEGRAREYLTLFLGIFSMSFCFYCCCCFCCGGSVCRWIANWHHNYFHPSKLLPNAIKITEKIPGSQKRRRNSFFISNVSSSGDCMMVDVSNNKKPYAYVNDAFANSSEHQSIKKIGYHSRNILISGYNKESYFSNVFPARRKGIFFLHMQYLHHIRTGFIIGQAVKLPNGMFRIVKMIYLKMLQLFISTEQEDSGN